MAKMAIASSLFRRLSRPMRVQRLLCTVGIRIASVPKTHSEWATIVCLNPLAATLPWSFYTEGPTPCFHTYIGRVPAPFRAPAQSNERPSHRHLRFPEHQEPLLCRVEHLPVPKMDFGFVMLVYMRLPDLPRLVPRLHGLSCQEIRRRPDWSSKSQPNPRRWTHE